MGVVPGLAWELGSETQSDPTGAASSADRVKRGGSWNNNDNNCTVSNRNMRGELAQPCRLHNPNNRNNNIGFRVVRPQPGARARCSRRTGPLPANPSRFANPSQRPPVGTEREDWGAFIWICKARKTREWGDAGISQPSPDDLMGPRC